MSNFSQGQGSQGITRRRTNWYVAQVIPQIDAEIAEKGRFWTESSEVFHTNLLKLLLTEKQHVLINAGFL
jgi:hypothetical protein